ncbi:hypothetical protein D3C76_1228860 [compost metagenome]
MTLGQSKAHLEEAEARPLGYATVQHQTVGSNVQRVVFLPAGPGVRVFFEPRVALSRVRSIHTQKENLPDLQPPIYAMCALPLV